MLHILAAEIVTAVVAVAGVLAIGMWHVEHGSGLTLWLAGFIWLIVVLAWCVIAPRTVLRNHQRYRREDHAV